MPAEMSMHTYLKRRFQEWKDDGRQGPFVIWVNEDYRKLLEIHSDFLLLDEGLGKVRIMPFASIRKIILPPLIEP